MPRLRRSDAKKADPSLVDVASTPKGRILPSLVPDESVTVSRSKTPSATPSRVRPTFAGAEATAGAAAKWQKG